MAGSVVEMGNLMTILMLMIRTLLPCCSGSGAPAAVEVLDTCRGMPSGLTGMQPSLIAMMVMMMKTNTRMKLADRLEWSNSVLRHQLPRDPRETQLPKVDTAGVGRLEC